MPSVASELTCTRQGLFQKGVRAFGSYVHSPLNLHPAIEPGDDMCCVCMHCGGWQGQEK